MQIDDLFPQVALNEAEEEVLRAGYTHPAFKKHLQIMALEIAKDLIQISASSNAAEVTVRSVVKAQGRLEILLTLLSLSSTTKE